MDASVIAKPAGLAFFRLNPEAAINFAYDHHTQQDPDSSKESKVLARRALGELHRLKAQPETDNAWYISQALSIIISYGNSITNLKKQHVDELRAAEMFLRSRQDQLTQSQTWGAFFRGSWRVAGTFAMSLFGFMLTKVLALVGAVPEPLLNQQGRTETTASILVAIVFFVVTGTITTWWNNLCISRMNNEYAALNQNAHVRYAVGKQQLLEVNWEKLCRIWKDYTGQEWGMMPAYLRVTRSEVEMIVARTSLLQDAARSNMSTLNATFWMQVERIRKRLQKKSLSAQ